MFKKIADLMEDQHDALFLTSGIDVDVAARFFEMGYRVHDQTATGEREHQLTVSRHIGASIDSSNSSMALTFAADAAIRLQSIGGTLMTRRFIQREREHIGSREWLDVAIPSALDDKYS